MVNLYYCIPNFDVTGDFVAKAGVDKTSAVAECASKCDADTGCDFFTLPALAASTDPFTPCFLKKLAFAEKSSGRTESTKDAFATCLQVAVYGTYVEINACMHVYHSVCTTCIVVPQHFSSCAICRQLI